MNNQYNQFDIDNILSNHVPPKENKHATQKLLESFPEFNNSKFYGQTDKELPYLVFADFCRFLVNEIKIKKKDDLSNLLIRVSEFITVLYSSHNKNLKDLVRIGVFESLSDDSESIIFSDYLPKNISEDFKSFFIHKNL